MIKQTGDGGNFTSAQAAGRMASVLAKLHSARSLDCATMEATMDVILNLWLCGKFVERK